MKKEGGHMLKGLIGFLTAFTLAVFVAVVAFVSWWDPTFWSDDSGMLKKRVAAGQREWPLSEMNTGEWQRVCWWGPYGVILHDSDAFASLGTTQDVLESMVSGSENMMSLIFQMTDGALVPLYFNVHAIDNKGLRVQNPDTGQVKHCYERRENPMFIVE